MFKEQFLEDVVATLSPRSILDLGSGTSASFVRLLAAHPEIEYVGVEPHAPSAKRARELLAPFPNARVVEGLAYDATQHEQRFDLVISLSVLEHVKRLDRFLAMSVAACKPGGHVVHWYDLGHALYPSDLKERFHVFLGNAVPWLLPELKYVAYVDVDRVARVLAAHGARVLRATHHQMAAHKAFANLSGGYGAAVAGLVRWEHDHADAIAALPPRDRGRLFPSIAVWARKG